MNVFVNRMMPPRGFIYLAPILIFLSIAAALLWEFASQREGHEYTSAILDDAVPSFSLPPLEGSELPGFSDADLRTGEVVLVNVFASWCYPCRVEHRYLMDLSRVRSIPIYGINYKDKPSDALEWLDEDGNPFVAIGGDEDGRVSIDWGISGVPETLLIDQSGAIRYRHVGPLDPNTLEDTMLPLVRWLREWAS